MPRIKFILPLILITAVITVIILLIPGDNVSAQCGSQASSCKNCHEVQAQDPVNNDGTGWHTGHAFGDFCYLCHAGNNQSMDKSEAHAGMVPPLSDVKAACQSCHPGDLMERAQVYATALGVKIGTGSGTPPGGDTNNPPMADDPAADTETNVENVIVSDTTIDYSARYDQEVLGKRVINWGNLIVTTMILMIAFGGGAFVLYNERKRRGLPFLPSRTSTSLEHTPIQTPVIEGYSQEVLELLPKINQLNPVGLHALKRLLEDPKSASELLHSLSRLDPELVRRIRNLDKESRALLLALSGD